MKKLPSLIRTAALAVGLAVVAPVPAAFAGGNIIIGTTDTVHTVDPARCYSFYCSNVIYNVGQTLVDYPGNSTKLQPSIAKAMPKLSDGGKTYTFELRKGITFQNGDKLTSKDVKFSLDRSLWINHPEGAGFLLSGISSIDTPNPYEVVIHLSEPDSTFVSKLAYAVATILPHKAYKSPNGPIPNDAKPEEYNKYISDTLIGSGPYKIANFKHNQSMLLETWKGYWGHKPSNDKVLIQFFAKSSQMLVALKSGEIDVAFRHFTPDQRASLRDVSDIKTIRGDGAAIRYLVFNPYVKPADSLKVRRAVAAAVDRARIVKDVFSGDAGELYSMVPPAFKQAYVPQFKTDYGDKKASDYLDSKVDLTLWYSRGHYGDTETKFAQTVKRELDETGLFNVTLKSAEWAQFTASAYPGSSGHYAAFLMGWYPDYLDPDDYLAPFYNSKESFLRMYDNPKMDELLEKQKTANGARSQERMDYLHQIQKIAAKDTPIVPLILLEPFAFARKDISGIKNTMGAAQIFHYGVMSKKD